MNSTNLYEVHSTEQPGWRCNAEERLKQQMQCLCAVQSTGHTRCAGRSPRLHGTLLRGCLHGEFKNTERPPFSSTTLAGNPGPSNSLVCSGVTDLVFVIDRRAWQHRNAAANCLKALGKTLWFSRLQRTSGGRVTIATLDGAAWGQGGGSSGAEPAKYTYAQQQRIA